MRPTYALVVQDDRGLTVADATFSTASEACTARHTVLWAYSRMRVQTICAEVWIRTGNQWDIYGQAPSLDPEEVRRLLAAATGGKS